MVALHVRWIFPTDAEPVANAYLLVAEGRVLDWSLKKPPGACLELGNVAILPGLVNAHTHLEFSDLAQPLAPPRTAFPDWISQVLDYRRARDASPEGVEAVRIASVQRGLEELSKAGTTLAGEIVTEGWTTPAYRRPEVGGVLFREILGLAPDRRAELLATAERHLTAADPGTPGWQRGLSPHAPYTVGPELLQELCRLSNYHQVPLAMHLAESFGELELLRSGSGELVHWLQARGAWNPTVIPRGLSPLDYLQWLSSAHRSLIIHGNYLGEDEWAYLAERRERMSVVYCPRTRAFFGPAAYPLEEMLQRGVRLALGTDSRATNPDLSVWEELRFVAENYPSLPLPTVLKMGTAEGADALGFSGAGRLEPGGAAPFTAVQLPDHSPADPYEALFAGQVISASRLLPEDRGSS